VPVRRAIRRRYRTEAGRRAAYAKLKHDRWAGDPYLSRMMRKHWRRGRSRTANQIVVRSDQYRTFTLADGGDVWLAVPGLKRREPVKSAEHHRRPHGTLRLILRAVPSKCTRRRRLDAEIQPAPVRHRQGRRDKVLGSLADSDGAVTAPGSATCCGPNPTSSKSRTPGGQDPGPLPTGPARPGRGQTDRVEKNNLGTAKRNHRRRAFEAKVRASSPPSRVVDRRRIVAGTSPGPSPHGRN
jgi:hypothetical protein